MTSGALEFPWDWRLSTVGEEFRIDNHLREPISDAQRQQMQGPFPYYGPTKAVDFLDHYRVEGTYALIGEDGDHFFKYRNLDMTQLVHGRFNVNNHAHLVRGDGESTTEWFFQYFRTRPLTHFLTRQGVGRFKLNKASLEQLPIPMPSRREQLAVHRTVDRWDHAITLTKRLIAAKQQRRRGLMQQLLTGKRRFPECGPGRSNTQRVPIDWEFPRTDGVFESYSIKNKPEEPVLSVTQDQGPVPRDSLERRIHADEANIHTYKLVEPGSFIISLRSFQGGLEYCPIRGLVSPAYHVIRPKQPICLDYYRYYFKSPDFVKRLAVAVIGIRDGKQVSYADFSFMHIPVPPLAEQEKIALLLTRSDHELTLLQSQLTALKTQKRGLMQQLLTGKVRVPLPAEDAELGTETAPAVLPEAAAGVAAVVAGTGAAA